MVQKSGAAHRFMTEAADIPFWHVAVGDEEAAAVAETMRRKSYSMGAVTAELEAELARMLDVPYALCTTSGSVALMMALAVHGIGPGDEVLVPTRTFIATAHAPLLLGAKPVLVDSRPDTSIIDMDDARRKITSRTRAIIPVHLNGRSADMKAVLALADQHNLVVIEDACQGLFSRDVLGYQGTVGNAGCFSFGMVKLAATGQGGAIVTRDAKVFETLRRFRNHGVDDIVTHAYKGPGGNFKFNDVLASIGLVQVRRRDQKVAHVNAVYKRYVDGLAGLPFIQILPVAVDQGEVALWTEVVSDERDAIMDHLAAHGIQTRKFHPCCHDSVHLLSDLAFPNSERFALTGFNLPCGPDMAMENIDRTIAVLRDYQPLGRG